MKKKITKSFFWLFFMGTLCGASAEEAAEWAYFLLGDRGRTFSAQVRLPKEALPAKALISKSLVCSSNLLNIDTIDEFLTHAQKSSFEAIRDEGKGRAYLPQYGSGLLALDQVQRMTARGLQWAVGDLTVINNQLIIFFDGAEKALVGSRARVKVSSSESSQ